jgi:hypothetical protein
MELLDLMAKDPEPERVMPGAPYCLEWFWASREINTSALIQFANRLRETFNKHWQQFSHWLI